MTSLEQKLLNLRSKIHEAKRNPNILNLIDLNLSDIANQIGNFERSCTVTIHNPIVAKEIPVLGAQSNDVD